MGEGLKPSDIQIDVKGLLKKSVPRSLAEGVPPLPFLSERNLWASFEKVIVPLEGKTIVYARLSIGYSRDLPVDMEWVLAPFKTELGEPTPIIENKPEAVHEGTLPQGTVHRFFWKLGENPPVQRES
ncbi:MAG: hypothetical protein Q7S60_03435 [bacterium]|nr:hypothetical protein [bacterium]